ncbi:GGDEF domain-containing protein [Dyella acidiphila]|uniref:diguanylate cyclase n=1 Tax=Dyella acidiphila TaxID=2775866 RepID=A0ABR9G727_9GAMM|nr:GGDEF domain-containing protein [Dyella acidiphila]MBE1159851.1 diguanylate cyclase [Dyella acidiphila]
MFACVVPFAAQAQDDTAQLFARADDIKTIDNVGYAGLIDRLEHRDAQLSDAQRWHLRYLEAWQAAYTGQNEKAGSLLAAVARQAPDTNIRMQAKGTLINILGVEHRYEEAFSYLDQALEELPHISNKATRFHVLAEASQLLTEAGQYDLAITYADDILLDNPGAEYTCIGTMVKLHAELRQRQSSTLPAQFRDGVADCVTAGDSLSADTIRRDMANYAIQQGQPDDAISLLQNNYADVLKVRYLNLVAEYNDLLAMAYWKKGDAAHAEKYADATLDLATKGNFIEPLDHAYQLLYQIAQKKGDLRNALAYHEKYMDVNKGHLDDVSKEALAYQAVKQQIDTKKVQLDTLSQRNKILKLQQTLDFKAMQTSRLYIVLLLTVLASVAFWLYRTKRSQLRFMRMSRRDGLTGVFNRQHFIAEAERVLREASKSAQCTCLVLIDLDHFKAINDTHGHAAGDQALKRVVAICKRYLHSNDIFGRLGGEEFCIVLPECVMEDAMERADQIRRAICAVSSDDSREIPLSASLGIASTRYHGHDLRQLLMAADEALYRAKRDGRNRVVINISGDADERVVGL